MAADANFTALRYKLQPSSVDVHPSTMNVRTPTTDVRTSLDGCSVLCNAVNLLAYNERFRRVVLLIL